MRFKTDENLPLEAAGLLRQAGRDAATILEQQMGGDPDENVASACRREDRVLVTLDLDFADLRTYPPESHPGVVVLRLGEPPPVVLAFDLDSHLGCRFVASGTY